MYFPQYIYIRIEKDPKKVCLIVWCPDLQFERTQVIHVYAKLLSIIHSTSLNHPRYIERAKVNK